MHDIHKIRSDPDAFDHHLKRRGIAPCAQELRDLDKQHRETITAKQQLLAKRNQLSREVAQAKQHAQPSEHLQQQVLALRQEISAHDAIARDLAQQLQSQLESLPNAPLDSVPEGLSEDDNVTVRTWGEPTKLPFEPKAHELLLEQLEQYHLEQSGKISGARFAITSGQIARLERALAWLMLDMHTSEFGYREVSPPSLVNHNAVYGTGQLPKFAHDLFATTTHGLWLIPTAEVILTNLAAGQIYAQQQLPKRYVAWTPCYRSEAGSAGRDTKGLLRLHQFYKVELVSITDQQQSESELERMLNCAEDVLKRLELPYRVLTLCCGDMGFSASKTYDIEVWMPAQALYREISSCSVCGDFQARRMNARYRDANSEKIAFVHSLNGSGLAVGRTLAAVVENYQQPDGSIRVPTALLPYMGGAETITAATPL